jgi:hypothetical protein
VITKLFGKGQFLLSRGAGRCFIRRAMDQMDMRGKRGQGCGAVSGADFRHLNQRCPAEAAKAEEAAAKGLPALAGHLRRVFIPEGKATWHGPFAGLGGLVEDHGI